MNTADTSSPPKPVRVALTGTSGFGARHLDNIRRLENDGLVTLAAAINLDARRDPGVNEEVPVFGSVDEALSDVPDVDVVIVSTPIHAHYRPAVTALEYGADVLLEKPPVANVAQFEQVSVTAERHGRLVQVGFQSLGSQTLDVVEDLVASGEIGRLRAVTATGTWSRAERYFARNPWAGRRVLDGADVMDGVITNPLAHAVATALRIAGARRSADLAELRVELYRANDIESDDTSVVLARTRAGIAVTAALTLTAAEQSDPFVTIWGTEGHAVLHYTRDRVTVHGAAGERTIRTGRTDLLENLVAARNDGARLLSPIEDSGAFVRVLEAVRTAPAPRRIAPGYLERVEDTDGSRIVLPGVEQWVERAVTAHAGFASVGAPWAAPADTAERMTLGTTDVAVVRTGRDVFELNGPRPFLHPVCTRSGVTVTDQQPVDHPWHLGVSVAVQDVDGINFWGGRTFTRDDQRYLWRRDHGRIERTGSRQEGDRLEEDLAWFGPDGGPVIAEHRVWSVSEGDDTSWELGLEVTLAPAASDAAAAVTLGSPGSNGREGGGYGGIFWRLPAPADPRVFTPDAAGEEVVHGSHSAWLAVSAEFPDGPATLVFRRTDDADDPWFVRMSGYPGVGLSLAWDTPVVTTSANPVHRGVRVLVVDGLADDARVNELIRLDTGSLTREEER